MIEFALLALCLEHGIDHDLIRAIAKQESAGQPNAFYINQWELTQFRDLSIEEAVLVAGKMVKSGYTVDVGLMGINSRNIHRVGATISQAFDPCTNINMGEQILFDNIQRAERNGHQGDHAIKVALSLYNTGSLTRGFDNGYVEKVWTHYTNTLTYQAYQSDITVKWKRLHQEQPVIRVTPKWLESVAHE